MARLSRKDPEYWRRKHSKGIQHLEPIECLYQTCKYKTISFTPENGLPHNMNWCMHPDERGNPLALNMNYWEGLYAPNWCPRRKNPAPR